jgi:signal recognition particle GTPase
MKKIFTICAATVLFAACNNNKDLETKKDVVVIDTTGMYHNNASTDIAKSDEVVAPPQAEVKTITKLCMLTERLRLYNTKL